jgi:hypothetical protein
VWQEQDLDIGDIQICAGIFFIFVWSQSHDFGIYNYNACVVVVVGLGSFFKTAGFFLLSKRTWQLVA